MNANMSLLLPVFISHRREDSAAEAAALARLLRQEFGVEAAFLDSSSIELGDTWPEEIKNGLDCSRTVLAVIGPGWLKSFDQWGRRRLDLEGDWVRREIVLALAENKTVIPVLVRGATLPPAEALPEVVRSLLGRQKIDLRADYWDHDVTLLVSKIQADVGATKFRLTDDLADGMARRLAYCREQNLKFRSAHLLAALLELEGEFVSASFEIASRGYVAKLKQMIDIFISRQSQREAERVFEPLAIEEHPIVLEAFKLADGEGTTVVDERHFLLAFLESGSSLATRIRNDLGPSAFARLLKAVVENRPGRVNIRPTPESLFD
jgi:hypothetical protein